MAITKNSQIDLNGNEMILDADADTTITADTDDQIDIKVAGSDKVQINATGLGIGQVPTRDLSLHAGDASSVFAHFTNTDTGTTSSDGLLIGLGSSEDLVLNNQESSKNIIIENGGSERMRVTSDGDLLVRQTSADVYDTNTGGTVRQYWGNQFSAQNNTNTRVIIGSASNAGLVGGATVNSGGTRPIVNSYISFGSTNQTAGSEAGMIQFYTSTGGAAGANRARIDSDGLKFGSDTAAANALDDYEQGTWTPTLPNGGTINTNYSSRYTKIGNVVYWHSYLLLSFANDSNAFRVTLPFNTSSVTSNTYVHGTLGYTGSVATDDLRSHVQQNANPAYIYFHETDGTSAVVTNSNLYARNYGDGRVTAFLMSGWYYTED